jgi:YHS domain-containing protein
LRSNTAGDGAEFFIQGQPITVYFVSAHVGRDTMKRHFNFLPSSIALLSLLGWTIGCQHQETASERNLPAQSVPLSSEKSGIAVVEGEHAHKPSAHGGIIVPIGSDSYHAEAVFEQGGALRLYTLGRDEAQVMEVDEQTLQGFVRQEGMPDAQSIELAPNPQADDRKGKTSLFIGKLPESMVGKKVEVTIPSIRIGEERFRLGFQSVPDSSEHQNSDDHQMPAKVADDQERKLYLTPGGKYTQADIEANGNQVASAKFAGIKAQHDAKPQSGDALCPISMTKANPKFSWMIDGKTYEFCCPPCVDEFVAMAKETPEKLLPPEAYRK